jgi:predicted DNA-binding WGR domain protein
MPPRSAATWEWQDDDGSYKGFDGKHVGKVETTYAGSNGVGVHNLDLNGWKYEFDFDQMTQKNLDSNRVRRIRRAGPPIVAALAAAGPAAMLVAAPAAPPPPVVWSWLGDKGAATPYADAHVTAIEHAFQAAASSGITFTKLKLGPYPYTIDFLQMAQINDESKKSRPIRRTGGAPGSDVSAAIVEQAKKSHAKVPPAAGDDNSAPLKKSMAETADGAKSAATGGGDKSAGGKSMAGGGTKLLKKGNGVVDQYSGLDKVAHVFEESGVVWQCTLNQTNIGTNNNKYYVIQLLEHDSGSNYHVFTRWGRVGSSGQSSLEKFGGSLPGAKALFCSKFRDKTKNDWNSCCKNHDAFTKYDGKYHLMDIVHGAEDDDDDAVDHVTNAPSTGSGLPSQLQRLMKMIGSKGDMTKAMKELEIDTTKMPLGKVSKKQIKDAFGHLKNIENELKKPKPNHSVLLSESSMFYTLVPHDFGMSKLPVIADLEHMKRKMDMLEMLSDLEVASKVLSEGKKAGKHPLDASYEAMKCELLPVDAGSEEFQRICRYVAHTHGATHHIKVSVEGVFKVNRAGETTRYEANYGKLHNKTMLWHGSRTTNFMGILSQGLRIAPPEAPTTGYMFGKGVYFADSVTKSANYCHSATEGLLLLCETALGNMHDCTAAKYMDKPQSGTQSTRGVGRNIPDPHGDEVDANGVKFPCGKMVPGPVQDTALLYNEFVVYDVSQVRMSYLVMCKFGKK